MIARNNLADISQTQTIFKIAPSPHLDHPIELARPDELDAAAFGAEDAHRGGVEVLLDDGQVTAVVELDQVAGVHPQVDDIADRAGGADRPVRRGRVLGADLDLLRADAERLI